MLITVYLIILRVGDFGSSITSLLRELEEDEYSIYYTDFKHTTSYIL